jgi:hypothetical protein
MIRAAAMLIEDPGHAVHIAADVVMWAAGIYAAILLGSSLVHGRMRAIYREHFQETPRERLFLASLGFFVAFAVVRAITHSIRAGVGPFHNVEHGGRHIHHLVFGIALLLAVGYGWLVQIGTGERGTSTWAGRAMALFYGIGAALTLDEFALWLNLRDVYWSREGRVSIGAVFLFGSLLSVGIWGAPFLRALTRETIRLFRRA